MLRGADARVLNLNQASRTLSRNPTDARPSVGWQRSAGRRHPGNVARHNRRSKPHLLNRPIPLNRQGTLNAPPP